MKQALLKQFRAFGLLLCILPLVCAGGGVARAQDSATAQLLGKAHALEVRGRMDMAQQVWQQVLLTDSNNTEALAGLARAEKSAGHIDKANGYLAKLRAINPNDPNIAKVENMGTAQDPSVLLKQAGQLSQQGQYGRAMAILKQVYGNNPPPGDAALSYYQTEAATEDTRPEAIAGLRAMADKYPDDSRYEVALGKILTYNARTRAEGRKLLAKHPNDPDASEALRQALVWDAQNPNAAGDIRAYIAKHPDQQLQSVLSDDAKIRASQARRAGPSLTPEQKEANNERAEMGREVQLAYSALNAKRFSEAEQRFNVLLEKNPNDPKALAGLGYIRMQQANFAGAISYLSQAQQSGDHSAGLEKALSDARFYYTMRAATGALNEDDLNAAITDFQNAYTMRPTDETALQGLGGTLLKAEQPEPAITIYTQYAKLHPTDAQAWKGLFLSYAAANHFDLALSANQRIPPAIRQRLMHDPDYLRTLASVYSATNHDLDAQRILQQALQLPFPADARGLRADVQMQYAGLLEAAGHHTQAAGLYREVLAADSTNTNAWVGLIQTEHTLGNDADAFSQLSQMPPANFQAAMQEPGFATTVASIYISQGRDDLAQNTLVEFLNYQQANNQKPFVAAQVTLANLYLKHNDTAKAFPLFENILTNNADRPDAWKGLLNSLHATGHDQEALAEIQQMPVDMRRQLEADPDYLQLVGNIYAGLGHPQDAMRFLNRAQAHYKLEGMTAPTSIDIQSAWLLYNASNDPALYKQLMLLGARRDLTDQERRTVQVIWASWAVRRAQQSSRAGSPKRAIAILNAAANAFPNNPGVLKALGSGYSSAGLYKESIAIFRAQDLSTGTPEDYRAAVGAALSGNDLKDAETWLRFGLAQYPRDSQLLALAAKFETAHGDAGRAADYYRASLSTMPLPDPGAELAEALSHGPVVSRLPGAHQSQDLATLLAQPDSLPREGSEYIDSRPYLPSYANAGAQAPIIVSRGSNRVVANPNYVSGDSSSMDASAASAYTADPGASTYVAPASGAFGGSYPSTTVTPKSASNSYSGAPQSFDSGPISYPSVNSNSPSTTYIPQVAPEPATTSRPNSSGTNTQMTLGDYIPQSSLFVKPLPGHVDPEQDAAALHFHVSQAEEAKYRSFVPGQNSVVDPYEAIGMMPVAMESIVRGDGSAVVSFKDATWKTTAGSGTMLVETGFESPAPQQASSTNPFATLEEPAAKKKPASHAKHTTKAKQPQTLKVFKPANPFANFGDPATSETSAAEHSRTSHAPATLEHTSSAGPKYVPPPIYVPGTASSSHSNLPASRTIRFPQETTAAQRAAAIRANQANAPLVLEGTSHPPTENYDTETNGTSPKMNQTQFSTSPYSPAQMQGGEVERPQAPPQSTDTTTTTTHSYAPSSGSTSYSQPDQQGQGQGTAGQQYPQPNTRSTTSVPRRSSSSTTTTRRTTSRPLPAPVVPVQQGPLNYPIYPQPLENTGTGYPPPAYQLNGAPSDTELQERGAPPLRGYYDPRVSENPKEPLTDREQTELDLALIEASYSSWLGGSVIGRYRSGRSGIDRLAALETPFEASFMLGKSARFNLIPKAVFLNAGQLVIDPNAVVGPLIGTLYSNASTTPIQQYASGVGGEAQFVTATFGAALGYSPYGFPVSNLIGRARWKPGNGHFTLYGGRDSVKETMLSYAGMRDPGSPFGNIWGGVVESGGGVRFDSGDEKSGLYVQAEGADVTGYHVLENHKYDGTMGAYFRVKTWPEYGSLNIGGTLFGEHYDYNERGETYGQGGYFSPNVYFLAAVPISFTGHWMEDLHYVINGSIGIQTFQEDSQVYFPLDGPSQAGVPPSACTPVCGLQVNSNTGANYSLDSQLSYHVNQHWYIGAFLSANNTNNYNTISGGVFARFLIKPQVQTVDYPTGLFPVEGFRPLRVP
jgi:tetratricopeptide (TPR) repeat protein